MTAGAIEKSRSPRIVSGGQTGVDQGALAAALDAGADCGGWCPDGRVSEQGVIPSQYPVYELSGAGYLERTLQNVIDSEGTAIVFNAGLEGGTRSTTRYCEQNDRPCVLIDAAILTFDEAVETLQDFIHRNNVAVLNVAGPRGSKWCDAHDYTYRLLSDFLASFDPE
jgi:hypothetical protein